MPLEYQQAKTAVFSVDNIRISIGEASVSRSLRVQTISFGDGYSQTIADGLNADLERWSIRTAPMSNVEAWGLESWLMRTRGIPFLWTPPDATKSFKATMTAGQVVLGYRDLASVSVTGYSTPTNYTVNLATGVITSVNIPNGTDLSISLTVAPRYYQLQNEWTLSDLSPSTKVASFELKRIYK